MNSTSFYATPYEPPTTSNEFIFEMEESGDSSTPTNDSPSSTSPDARGNTIPDEPEFPAPVTSKNPSVDEAPMMNPYREDEEPVYTNLAEMAAINNRREPPVPDVADRPRRVLNGGWKEYVNEAGRTYFFNSETGRCQWTPPRLMRSPSQVQAFMEATKSLEIKTLTTKPEVLSSSLDDEMHRKSSTEEEDEHRPPPTLSLSFSPRLREKRDAEKLEGPRESSVERETTESRDRVVSMSTFQTNASINLKNVNMAQSVSRLSHHSPPQSRSLSFKNRTTSLKQVHLPQVLPTSSCGGVPNFDAPPPPLDEVIPYSVTNEEAAIDDRFSRGGSSESARLDMRTVRSGPMERVIGERAKKREWTGCYLFLSSAHLLVYKDEKSAEKHGKHYEAPQLACDLRGASVSWIIEKEKRKRKVFQLELTNGQALILRTTHDTQTEEWFEALRDAISQLPSCSSIGATALSVSAVDSAISHPSTNPFSLVRNPSAVSISRPHSSYTVSRVPKKDASSDPMCVSAVDPPLNSSTDAQALSKDSIIERLKRFFRTRPTVESLKEKGIYKPEPVFGSTLAAICQLENTLVPKFIQVVTELIENRGLENDGLYRVSGNLSAVQKIRCQVDQNRYQLLVSEEDVHVLTGALKLFFRELAEPVFPSHMTKDFLGAIKLQNAKQRFKRFDELLKELPSENKETLKMLLRHLVSVAKNADKNRMQVHNLAIMFGPTLFSTGEEPRPKKKGDKKEKKKKDDPSPLVQSNSHMAFNMIMQGQIIEYLLNEQQKFEALQGPVRLHP